MSTIARLFMSGRSQALRLPAKLRLNGTEVRVEQIGSGLWIQPQTEAEHDMGRWLQVFYAQTEPLPDEFLAERKDMPPQVRDWT